MSSSSSPSQVGPEQSSETAVKILLFQLSEWYPFFREVTFPTEFVALEHDVADDIFTKDSIDFRNLVEQRPRSNSFNSTFSSDSGGWDVNCDADSSTETDTGDEDESLDDDENEERLSGLRLAAGEAQAQVPVAESDEAEVQTTLIDERVTVHVTAGETTGTTNDTRDCTQTANAVSRREPSEDQHSAPVRPRRAMRKRRERFADRYPDVRAEMAEKVRKLGGEVFPKLNWTAPRDAKWVATAQTLSCSAPEEVMTLLRASDFVQSDLDTIAAVQLLGDEELLSRQTKTTVCLRKYEPALHSGLEFRCFVNSAEELVGISQRDMTTVHDFLLEKNMEKSVSTKIEKFFVTQVKPRMVQYLQSRCLERSRGTASQSCSSEGALPSSCSTGISYCFDVYLRMQKPTARDILAAAEQAGNQGERPNEKRFVCILLDLASFPHEATDACLFRDDFEFIERLKTEDKHAFDVEQVDSEVLVETRLCRSEQDLRPDACRYNTMPIDLWEFTSKPDDVLEAIQKLERNQRTS
ncbi:unnamed protein product [Amoebophrya sp. A25]|nr:unnamed protein product [Amoebophrya sp. A25]|eukprot:GSA25T00005987001.1